MFEAIHGSAPRRAGQNLANPSGLLLGAIQMLVHIGQGKTAAKIHNAWLKTIEDGIHTYDIYHEGVSKRKVGTKEFAKAIMERLDEVPKQLAPAKYIDAPPLELKYKRNSAYVPAKKILSALMYLFKKTKETHQPWLKKSFQQLSTYPLIYK
jgi:isocitrate dehydrogenase